MYQLIQMYEATRDFMELGGIILTVIGWVTLLMWILIIERVIFFVTAFKDEFNDVVAVWDSRVERRSWNAYQIREAMVSRTAESVNQFLPMIKTLVSLCPLLGLLGTVTGMIEVFDVMAVSGTGSARSMASGVSKATIPTMAGMVAALSGVFASTWLSRKANTGIERLRETLTTDH